MSRGTGRFIRVWILAGASFALLAAGPVQTGKNKVSNSSPIDPQRVQDQDLMTWDDYRSIPGKNWADPALKPDRGFKLAVVGIDFPGQPFVITLPKGSDPFGNPQIDPVAHPPGAGAHLNSDIYRLSVSAEGKGWTARILNGLEAAAAGSSRSITVYATPDAGSSVSAKVTLKAVSESDPAKSATATVVVSKK